MGSVTSSSTEEGSTTNYSLRKLRQLLEATGTATGQEFFERLVLDLPIAVGADHALVGVLAGRHQQQTRTLAVSWDGELGQNFVYELHGTPCEVVLARGELAYFPSGVAAQFPEDIALRKRGVESYMGTHLVDAKGDSLGMLAVLGSHPLDEAAEPASILRLFAQRTATELERQRNEQRLAEAQNVLARVQKMEALGRFASSLVHDFNNVLQAVTGGCYAAATAASVEEREEAIADIQNAADHGAELARRLMTFAKKQPSSARDVTVVEVLDSVAPMMRQLLGKRVALVVEPIAEELLVHIDAAQLEQALLNLVVNARDAIDGTGTVTVSAIARNLDGEAAKRIGAPRAGRYVGCMVRDDGEGMTEETLQRACEPFFSTKPSDRGTGLGLASCHGVAAAAGGTLLIGSARGVGTTVTLLLPVPRSRKEVAHQSN